MSIPEPKTVRNSLVTKLTALTQLQAVYDHLTKDTQGQSPVVMVARLGIEPTEDMLNEADIQFLVGVWVDRSDAATAEDELDDLAKDIIDQIHDWNGAQFVGGPSEITIEDADNAAGQYLCEWFTVQVRWVSTYS